MRITEIYVSVVGETRHAGRVCTLVRTTGCDLRCTYCDTAYAFSGGVERSVAAVAAEVEQLRARLVLLTGGEPLLQPDLPELVDRLLARGLEVMVETGGSQDLSLLPPGVIRIVDIKTPGSGELEQMRWENLELLGPDDAVKLVLTSADDYRWAVRVLEERGLSGRTEVLFSAAYPQLEVKELAAWIVRDRLQVRLNLQVHKAIWGADARGI